VIAVSMFAEIMLALGGIIAISTASVIVIARVLFRRIRRSRAVNNSALRARALMSVGPQHEVLALRVRLAETLDSGRDALDLARRTGSPLGDLGRLYGRIRDDGTALDAQLLLLLSERDPAVLRLSIPVAERRVDQVVGLIRRLRSAVAAGLGDRTDDNLAMLTGDLDREVTALDAGLNELHTLNGYDAPTILNPLTGRTDS
jgi:hypothetical protein